MGSIPCWFQFICRLTWVCWDSPRGKDAADSVGVAACEVEGVDTTICLSSTDPTLTSSSWECSLTGVKAGVLDVVVELLVSSVGMGVSRVQFSVHPPESGSWVEGVGAGTVGVPWFMFSNILILVSL